MGSLYYRSFLNSTHWLCERGIYIYIYIYIYERERERAGAQSCIDAALCHCAIVPDKKTSVLTGLLKRTPSINCSHILGSDKEFSFCNTFF
jgi:hypothetical protein